MKDHLPPDTIKQHFDVFLSHNSKDKPAVEALAIGLADEAKLQVWLDKWNLIPGEPWQEEIERALDQAHTCAVFLGPHEFGGWHHEEMRNVLARRVEDPERKFRVIPVLLPGATMPDRSKLPAFLSRLTWVDFRQGLDDAEAFRRLVAGIRGIAPGRAEGSAKPANIECPYRGLEVFDEEHARFFFGREAMTQHLVEALRPTRFLCVLGPSGSGKSSLARAGLLPQLRAGQLPGSQNWQYLVFKPGAHPIEELALNLAALRGAQSQVSTATQLINDFKTTETALHLFARLLLRTQVPDTKLFLLVDQFEEVFTLCQDAAERAQFIKNLRFAGTIEGGRVVIVPTMRADFLARAAESPDLAELLSTHQFIVNPMEPDELRRAIEEPARLAGLRFEPGLIERILNDVGHEPGALPLLEHALRELFEKRSRENVLTVQAYEQSGGVQGALAQKAEAIYARFTTEQQAILRRVMLRLTQPGEGTADTRRRATLHEFWQNDAKRAAIEKVLFRLADERLLITSRDASGEEQVDVSHEALIRGWPRLNRWINDDREGLRLHHRLTEDAKEWWKQGKDESFLYRGARLEQAMEWRVKNSDRLIPLENDFLITSRNERDAQALAQEKRRRRSQRIAWSVTAVIAALLITLVVISRFAIQRDDLYRQEIYKIDIRLAAEALDADAYSRYLDLLTRYLPDRLSFFQKDVRDEQWDKLWKRGHDEFATLTLKGNEGSVNSLAFHPDGKTLAMANSDKTIKLWDVRSQRNIATLEGHEDSVNGVAFSPDGKILASASNDRTVKLWNVRSQRNIATLEGHEGSVNGVAFSPDGKTLASAGGQITKSSGVNLSESRSGVSGIWIYNDKAVKLWDVSSRQNIATLKGHGGAVGSVVFSPDGKTLASTSDDQTVRLWDVFTRQNVATLNDNRKLPPPRRLDFAGLAAFSADGKTFVSFTDDSNDQMVKLWDVSTHQNVATLKGIVNSVALSPDGKTLALASDDWRIKLWDVASEQNIDILKGHEDKVMLVVFSPDGKTLASASNDRKIKLWDITARLHIVKHVNEKK